MSCERMESRILAYMDGRLKDSERAEAEKHFAACAICRVRVNEFRSVSDLLGEQLVGMDAAISTHRVCRVDATAGDAVDWISHAAGGAAANQSGRSGCIDDAGHFGDGRSRHAGKF